VRDLVLQNVSLITQKLKFTLPPTKEFDMPYPEPFKLAPGMKKSIPISFRPSKYEPHVDQVKIDTKEGSFFVVVKACVKDIALTVHNFIDFGMCPRAEKSEQHIEVYNTGDLKAAVRWHAKPPFKVKAPASAIDVGQMLRCVVEFEPQDASVFDGLLECEAFNPAEKDIVDEDTALGSTVAKPTEAKHYFVKATGVGKMPHLCVPGASSPKVEFGSVFPGNRMPKTLELVNTTPVRASFKVTALHQSGEEVAPLPPAPFFVSPESGVVEPNQAIPLTFYFQSHTVKEFMCQRFKITTPGGTPLIVTCTAFSRPMEVRLSARSINFGEVQTGKMYTRTLNLHNDSDRPAAYHFVNADQMRGIFCFDRHMGVIPPNSFMVVTISFGPLAPMNYHKQVSCLIKGAISPLTLDLLGSAHNEKSRPARLDQKHVDIYRAMQLNGVREFPQAVEKSPSQMEAPDEEGTPAEEERTMEVAEVRTASATATFLEMMLPMDSKLRDVTMSPVDLDFGSCSTQAMSDKHSITITNRTSSSVTAICMLPGETRLPCTSDEKSLFSVYPQQCDIKPRGQADFMVSFRPQYETNYEGEVLEVVVNQKINRSFRLVDKQRFTPPWMVAIRGMGHTMGTTRNDPRLDFSESNIRFRACHPGERTYQVAMFTNPGDTCTAYRILPPIDASGSTAEADSNKLQELAQVPFRAWPTQGIIPPHHFHLIVLEFAPIVARNEKPFHANFQIVVDYNESHPKTLRVAGRSWEPQLSVCRGLSVVTFPPTCAGIASSMNCAIKNVSEIPISYECKIPSRFRNRFWFNEGSGQLAPSESSVVVANFCPGSEKVFSAPLYCIAKSVEDPDTIVEGPLKALLPRDVGGTDAAPQYVLQLVGHGKGPAISVDPSSLDLGAVRANSQVQHCVTILNSSNQTVYYTIEYEFVGTSDHPSSEVGQGALQLGSSGGQVAGRCTDTLDITFTPLCRGLFEYRIDVIPKGAGNGNAVSLMLRADVQYPYIQIADLRTDCDTQQPQSMMWTQFQVDGINGLYKGEVAEVERRFQAAIGIDEKKQLVRKLRPFQLLFGTSAAGSVPTVVYLALSNPSRLPLKFSFQTPKNLNLENVPYWCDEKALVDDREVHFSWVEEHGIFDILPRSGEIAPGDFVHVKMTYHHHSVGTHILPVVFNVHDGRSVLLYLKAHSVAPNVGCLSVRSSMVTLQPVPINGDAGTMQPVELSNSGCVEAPWRIDVQSIVDFNLRNYDFQVLSVTPREGVLQPQSSTFLHFTFTPLEAKSYACPVRIEMLKDGRPAEELIFEVRAEGYAPGDDRPQVEPLFPANLPIQTYAPVPGSGAALSIELLDFETCPLRANVSRMLILVNYTSDYILSFRWDARQLFEDPSELQIQPSRGELSPGSHCVVVFRLCCTEPADVSGEVACMLTWTHVSAYGQFVGDKTEEESGGGVEVLAFHRDHVHEPMKIGKNAGEGQQHISVANRLTVSRFRNLMSTAAGQKFLNENLHRTAVLASHIPTMSPQQKMQASISGVGAVSGGISASGPGSGTLSDSLGQPSMMAVPSSYPLYVRLRAVVSDWGARNTDNFLVLGPSASLEAWRGSGADDDEPPFTGAARMRRGSLKPEPPPGAFSKPGEVELSPDLIGGVMEHVIREVLCEDRFAEILDQALTQDTPYFLQYEDSLPPGDPDSHMEQLFAGDDLGISSMGADSMDPELQALLASRPDDEIGFKSNLLMDFEHPAATSAAAAAPAAGSGASASAASSRTADAEGATSPQRPWDEAEANYGEVDLETFKNSAGEVLDQMLLDMMDDVVAGRLNWMRPIPRVRPRR
jgi:hypothetical protein